jgi:hypothetical protein
LKPEYFRHIFKLQIFGARVSRFAFIPLIVALLPGDSDITRIRPWRRIARGNRLDPAKEKNFTIYLFDPRSGILDPLVGELHHV